MNKTSACLGSEKIILRLSKLDSTLWKVCDLILENTQSSSVKIVAADNIFNTSA